MYRLSLIIAVLAGLLLGTAAVALSQASDEIPLPPVKLKPEKPTTTQPIPPTPEPAAPAVTAPKAPVAIPSVPAEPKAATVPPPPTELPPVIVSPPPPAKAPPVEIVTPTKPAKPSDIEKETTEALIGPQPPAAIAGAGELGLVEEVARTRKAYARALAALKDYYVSRGSVDKNNWVDSEIAALDKAPKPQYLGMSELAGPNLKPTDHIEAADKLFEEGMNFKNYPALPSPLSTPGKDTYLKKALDKFTTIIEKYPTSDKIDDAAFRMGEIYGGWYFEDWTRAIQSYERCWQWNPLTEHPAMLNAAKIYADKLKKRDKAVELYNRVLAESNDPDQVKQARAAIKDLTGK
jgi:hypothetical protein